MNGISELRPVNYEESRVPQYTLPDPLANVTSSEAWTKKCRPEILRLFQEEMYGNSPSQPDKLSFEVTSIDRVALGGKAIRKEIIMHLYGQPVHLLLYLPINATKPVPVFVGVNFDGNQTVSVDPGITINEQWTWNSNTKTEEFIRPADTTRGKSVGAWSLDKILSRNYALAVIPRADVEPDYPGGWKHGVRGAWLKQSGKSEFASDDWGSISAWAWSLSRALDYLETDKYIDARRVVAIGHSRMGKAALWAGAKDERFAITISNNSGAGGAALARRCFGETTAALNKNFPHWFCANFKKYSDHEDELPFDQHELIALLAPRPVYVASAEEDRWADPRGEFLSAKGAEPVYRLFGKLGLGVENMPTVNQPAGSTIGYHIRSGKHALTEYDWEQYLNFADMHFNGK